MKQQFQDVETGNIFKKDGEWFTKINGAYAISTDGKMEAFGLTAMVDYVINQSMIIILDQLVQGNSNNE